jgi:hypothetical protein
MSEPWRELYGPFIERNFLDDEVAAYLWDEMYFRSMEALQGLPVDDKKNLQEQLKGCPKIEKLGLQLSLTRLRDDVAKTGKQPQVTSKENVFFFSFWR